MAKDFLSIRDFTPQEIWHFLDVACQIKFFPQAYSTALKGKTLAMIFEKPSLRTRVTFDVGIEELGGHPLYLSPAEISLGKRESVYDVAKNLERMVQGIMIRTFAHDIVVEMAEHANIPVINGLTDYSHPCQAMADYLTMLEVQGRIAGLKVAYVGDGNNVAHSLMFAGAQLGADVWIATPPGYEPDAAAVELGRGALPADQSQLHHHQRSQARGAGSGRGLHRRLGEHGPGGGSGSAAQSFPPYQVNGGLFAGATPDAIFLHCLPAHRGDEVTDEVIDSPRSFVFQQAENRLHAQKAIMLELMKDAVLAEREGVREAVQELVK